MKTWNEHEVEELTDEELREAYFDALDTYEERTTSVFDEYMLGNISGEQSFGDSSTFEKAEDAFMEVAFLEDKMDERNLEFERNDE